MLEKIKSPSDIRSLSYEQMNVLCGEIRRELIKTVSDNGGHLASNLGVVELTCAIHRKFDSPNDKIIFDVGHQCYTHKLLTGRFENFSSLRKENGISGFTRPQESCHDIFVSGHSSVAISQGLGLALSNQLDGKNNYVISVIGDGALSGGLAYEALNNAGRRKMNLIVVLNDNKMSISKNVGAMARHLAVIRSHPSYFRLKSRFERVLLKIPLFGKPLRNAFYWLKKRLKNLIYNSTIFEDMGFSYIGPVDGHDMRKLEDSLEVARQMKRPVLIHVCTVKGKGYTFAEKSPGNYHGVASGMDIDTGECPASNDSFSFVFGKKLCSLAVANNRICAITAAMTDGTGLAGFSRQIPERFFDVGIAEQHAVTFASGLAAGGKIPVVALYSTFLQRGFDQLIHDVALQKRKVIICVDRAGFVGSDGETHQGLFDVSFINSVPDISVYSPCCYKELEDDLEYAADYIESPVIIRYPKGGQTFIPDEGFEKRRDYRVFKNGGKAVLVTFGRLLGAALEAAEKLKNTGTPVDIIYCNLIKPVPSGALDSAMGYEKVFLFEEGMRNGGFSEIFADRLATGGYNGSVKITAVDGEFVPQMTVKAALKKYRLDSDGMISVVTERNVQKNVG